MKLTIIVKAPVNNLFTKIPLLYKSDIGEMELGYKCWAEC